jgi:anti-sigma regulatory factor (Ser/Thr protein kinase)
VVFEIRESSQVGELRRCAVALAKALDLTESESGALAIAVTEAATNLVKHAKNGEVLIDPVDDSRRGVRMLALDRGPGIPNLAVALGDGFSSAGSPGNGLGAIVRLSDRFEIHSAPEGTALLSEIWDKKSKSNRSSLPVERQQVIVSGVCLPKPGERVSGDAWATHHDATGVSIAVADGLGHGLLAAEAANEAIRIFQQNPEEAPGTLLQLIHDALRKTRGAAVAIAEINLEKQLVRFAGVGNISAMISNGSKSRSFVSHNGIVGHQIRKIQEFSNPLPNDAMLIMHSDGLITHWDLGRYAGIQSKHPSLIAGLLYRDFARRRDDVTVVVAKPGNPK